MDDLYETKITDARWIAYDIPGNVGWIMYIVMLVQSFVKQPVFTEVPLFLACMVVAVLPAIAMMVGIVELISERIPHICVLPIKPPWALPSDSTQGVICSSCLLVTARWQCILPCAGSADLYG